MIGNDIGTKSFNIIDSEAGDHGLPKEQWSIIRRMIHTSADFSFIEDTVISDNAIKRGITALKSGASIICDSEMIRAGLSISKLKKINPSYSIKKIRCYVSDKDVIRLADQENVTRSILNMRKAKDYLSKGIILIGNAPTALFEVIRLIEEEHVKPELIIGVPVGFVNVVESKERLINLTACIPYITIRGRKGGSTIAVAILHALINLGLGVFTYY